MDGSVILVDAPGLLLDVVASLATVGSVGLDVEGNGLFAYRPSLCTIQLAWHEAAGVRIAIVDTLAVDPAPLAPALGPNGPTKILHDLTFDARMLLAAGIPLDRVQDTSVMARMLGRKATGLASLISAEFGIELHKALQQHDWASRPITPEQIHYLASDVLHLHPLAARLLSEVQRLGIENEVEDECSYKLECARTPPPSAVTTSALRIKGVERLSPRAQAVLRALAQARETLAGRRDVPPFKIAPSALLIELARRGIRCAADLEGLESPFIARQRRVIVELLDLAEQSPPPPPDQAAPEPAPDRHTLLLRKTRQRRLSAWRHAEATARGVDEQVVLPGHCLQSLVRLEQASPEAIATVAGLGRTRFLRYGETIVALLGDEGET